MKGKHERRDPESPAIELTGASFLTLPELGELAARLDALHDKTLKTIDRLEGEIASQKARVAKHH